MTPEEEAMPDAREIFGRWTVLEDRGETRLCRCECGTEKRVQYYTLKAGKSKSCGCLKREERERQVSG